VAIKMVRGRTILRLALTTLPMMLPAKGKEACHDNVDHDKGVLTGT